MIIEKILNTKNVVNTLPLEGITGQLVESLRIKFEQISQILQSESFFEQAASLNDYYTEIENEIANTCEKFKDEQNENIKVAIEEIRKGGEWSLLDDEQKQEFSSRLDNAVIKDKYGIKGIREIITEVYSFNNTIRAIKVEIQEAAKPKPAPGKLTKVVSLANLPKRINSKQDLDNIIKVLTDLKNNWNDDEIIDIKW